MSEEDEVTIKIPKFLVNQMLALKSVNWNTVIVNTIKKYIELVNLKNFFETPLSSGINDYGPSPVIRGPIRPNVESKTEPIITSPESNAGILSGTGNNVQMVDKNEPVEISKPDVKTFADIIKQKERANKS